MGRDQIKWKIKTMIFRIVKKYSSQTPTELFDSPHGLYEPFLNASVTGNVNPKATINQKTSRPRFTYIKQRKMRLDEGVLVWSQSA